MKSKEKNTIINKKKKKKQRRNIDLQSLIELCLVPKNLKENTRERKYKGKVEGKKK